jgi:hypothetical protein
MVQPKHEDMAVEVDAGQCALQDTSPNADKDESNMEAGMQWENQVTFVEEEPWSEAVHATWPSYLPNV